MVTSFRFYVMLCSICSMILFCVQVCQAVAPRGPLSCTRTYFFGTGVTPHLGKACLLKSIRAAKFDPKVGSRRATKIENLVLVIVLVALILLPYYMYVVLVLILLFLLVRER